MNPRSWHHAIAMDARMNATEYCRLHDRVEGKADYCIQGLSLYHRNHAPLDVDSTVQVGP
jgi:hypothetical protein